MGTGGWHSSHTHDPTGTKVTLLLCEPKPATPERDGGSGTRLAELGALGWSRDPQGCSKFKWKILIASPGRRAAGYFFYFFFSQRGNAEGLVLIRLHYPFHSSFKSTKYTFLLRCPPRCSRQKKSNFPQFAPNSSPPLPGRPPAPLPFQTLDPSRDWETPSSEGTPRGHPGASKPALTAQGAAFPAPPSMGFAGSQQDPKGICCSHIPGRQRPATPKAPQSNILSVLTEFPRVLKL